jgi:uncharacterized surface protein with fasciclin (FAS1) repeats
MRFHRTPSLVVAALALAAQVQAQDQQQQQQQSDNVIAVLEAQGNHTQFLNAIRAAGLEETLKGQGTFTVFAPTDEAFAKLPEGKLDELMANPEAIKELVSYHIASEAIRGADVTEPKNVQTLAGTNVQVVKTGEQLQIRAPAPAAEMGREGVPPGGVVTTVVTGDRAASNGVVHSVDTVLLIEG